MRNLILCLVIAACTLFTTSNNAQAYNECDSGREQQSPNPLNLEATVGSSVQGSICYTNIFYGYYWGVLFLKIDEEKTDSSAGPISVISNSCNGAMLWPNTTCEVTFEFAAEEVGNSSMSVCMTAGNSPTICNDVFAAAVAGKTKGKNGNNGKGRGGNKK